MTVGLFGKKIGMTHIFDPNGVSVPVTLVKVETCQITQIKTEATDGYNAIQLGYNKKPSNKSLTKPIIGHLAKSNAENFSAFGEFRTKSNGDYKLGDSLTVETFTAGQKVEVSGKSIGKGFTGNQKRHNFARGPMTHGSKNHRLPGSVGAGSTPGRVFPGKKMAGQLGNVNLTIKTCEVLHVSPTDNILVLKGSLPGKANNILKITAKG